MSGPPVTIVESGGMPVVYVTSDAPELSVVATGGTPITLTDVGPPFVLDGYTPPPEV